MTFEEILLILVYTYTGQVSQTYHKIIWTWKLENIITKINSAKKSFFIKALLRNRIFKIFTYLLSLRSENILEAIESMNCEIYKYKPIRGGSFIPTPPKYARKKAIINIHSIALFADVSLCTRSGRSF